jgi:hypothetical protein
MKIIIILILFLILLIIYNNINNKELYDAKINNLKITTCANTCSRLYGCAGFAHKDNNTCYISHLPINNRPSPAIYSGEFNIDDIICNKVFPILSDKDITDDMLRENLIYDCYTRDLNYLGIKYFDGDNMIDLTNKNRDYIKPSYYDLNYLDPKREKNWENLTRNPLKYKYKYKYKVEIDDPEIYFEKYDKILYNEPSNNLNIQACNYDIDLNTCTNLCKKNNRCKSFEFINSLNNKNNICCLKTNISKINKDSTLYIKKVV